MVSYRKCNIMIIAALTVIVFITWRMASAEESNDPEVARNAGMEYMSNGSYDKAIQEFEKVIGIKDYNLQEALITCYLKVGQFSDARRVALGIKDNIEYQPDDPNEKVANVFLNSLGDCNNDVYCCFDQLLVAGKFAMELYPGNVTRRKVGINDKRYSAGFEKNSAAYKLLNKNAIDLLGEKHASGYKIENIDIDTYKVTFRTSNTIGVFEQEKGYFLTIIDVSNPIEVLRYYPEIDKTLPVEIGIKTEITLSTQLEFKAESGEYVIFKYEKN